MRISKHRLPGLGVALARDVSRSAITAVAAAFVLSACSSDESPGPTTPDHHDQANISGTARDGLGPIEGLTVTLFGDTDTQATAVTDAEGHFHFEMPPRPYDVLITAPHPFDGPSMQLRRIATEQPGFYEEDLELASLVVDIDWPTAADGSGAIILRWNTTTLGVQPVSIAEGAGHAELRGLLPVPVLIGVQLPEDTDLLYPPNGVLESGSYRTLVPGETQSAKLEAI